jgi:Flp pilus assembly protein TadG
MEGIKEAKLACVAEIQKKLNVDVSKSPSGWSSFAGTSGKGTTYTFSQTATAPGVVCITSNGKVVSLTKSETTQIQ